MYLKIVCLNQLNWNYFYLLPLRLLLLPLSKNCLSNSMGFCVYMINTIMHGCMEIWNFSSRVQFDISLNTRREIPYLSAPMYYCLFLSLLYCFPGNNSCSQFKRCSHICLAIPNGYTCACPDNMRTVTSASGIITCECQPREYQDSNGECKTRSKCIIDQTLILPTIIV